jgi:hypothetical protein
VSQRVEAMIREYSTRLRREQDAQIERDLIRLYGSVRRAERKLKRKGELIYQHAPNGAEFAQYRGIRLRGKWVVDHFPDWPTQGI